MTIRASLSSWIAESDAQSYVDLFPGSLIERSLETVQQRFAEYYISLVSELFDLMREAPTGDDSGSTWASLGNALADIANRDRQDLATNAGVSLDEARLFGATAFYCGGFPASAYIVANTIDRRIVRDDITRACVEILLRPAVLEAETPRALVGFIRSGDTTGIEALARAASDRADTALAIGPTEWVPATLLFRLLEQLQARNVRAVLPDGESDFWNPLVASFLARRPPVWEFFPSQILAINSGLLSRPETFSLQMPTGSGKTALTETVLYQHATANPGSPAVLIVPYRSLASELRRTLVRRLNALGVQARSSYGGSVPNPVETRDLDNLSVLVATPETLSGTLGANETFYRRVGLVVCDEGHLLDSDSRGVALELLLARLRARESGPPRFIFISAIVPNVDEINSWLGGTNDTVVVSDYRPALAEFALLRDVSMPQRAVDLVMHPEADEPTQFTLQSFLGADDFKFLNRVTGRPNTYAWASIKARAVAAARKALTLGPVAVFSATKGGGQGAIGLADELVRQLEHDLPLPNPIDFARRGVVSQARDYMAREYGSGWVGTRALEAGAVLHHGDIPQETREVLEDLVRNAAVSMVLCTSTLAEGVNLPIRTLVLYSTTRRGRGGQSVELLTRDIRNLVGRAGRPGASTRGLVICANEREWPAVENVALQRASEPVRGALHKLLVDLERLLARRPIELTNEVLENSSSLHPLIDGIDAMLIDLAAEEVGEEGLREIARRVAGETFAVEQSSVAARSLLDSVFSLRAARVLEARDDNRITWVRRTGARLRHVDSVLTTLLPQREQWDDIADPLEDTFLSTILDWAWNQVDLQAKVRDAYRLEGDADLEQVRGSFLEHVRHWLGGLRIVDIAAQTGQGLDETIRVQAQAVSYALQTLVEQSISLLDVALETEGRTTSAAVTDLPDHLRFGVPTTEARLLMAAGVRHRSAAVQLGEVMRRREIETNSEAVTGAALTMLDEDQANWDHLLGPLVVSNTRRDLTPIRPADDAT